MNDTDKVITLVYYSPSTCNVGVHPTVPSTVLTTDTLYIAESGMPYRVVYYNDIYKVAFTIAETEETENA